MSRQSKWAYGMCDRTGFRYPLKDLVEEYEQGKPTGRWVGRDMADPDHPQNWLGRLNLGLPDDEALENARPDPSLQESRNLFSWNPVGAIGLVMTGRVGSVKVTVG